MAQTTRGFGADVTVFSVGGASYLGDLVNATVNYNPDVQESGALKDTFRYPKIIRYGWSIDAEVASNTGDAPIMIAAIAGATVAVALTAHTTGTAYTGSGVITSASHNIPDGGQTERVTITGNTALTAS